VFAAHAADIGKILKSLKKPAFLEPRHAGDEEPNTANTKDYTGDFGFSNQISPTHTKYAGCIPSLCLFRIDDARRQILGDGLDRVFPDREFTQKTTLTGVSSGFL
jgi:hypothetical protein